MFQSPTKEEYVPLASQPDGESIESNSREDVVDYTTAAAPSASTSIPKYLIWACLAVACLSTLNVTLFPFTLKSYAAYPYTEAELNKLPYPDTRLGLDRAAKYLPPPVVWHYSWPDKIVRVSQKLKNAVYGSGSQVFISVEDSTIMRFPIPSHGTSSCAITFHPVPEHSGRQHDLETKGDVSQIEAWSVIAPNHAVSAIDFDELSWNTIPVRGELLGTLDLTSRPNTTTVEFTCPKEDTLTIEFRCLRVACHVKYMQVHSLLPKLGFQLVRRHQ